MFDINSLPERNLFSQEPWSAEKVAAIKAQGRRVRQAQLAVSRCFKGMKVADESLLSPTARAAWAELDAAYGKELAALNALTNG